VNHVDGFLGDGVEGGNGLGVGFKTALSNDQVGKLGGDVDVGLLKRRALNGGQTVGSRDADGCRTTG
jgi:hypothetical protein